MAKYRKVLVLGDTTTHGGRIISAWGETIDVTIDGKHVVCKGDKVICPRCKGIHTILTGADGSDGEPRMIVNGRPVAREHDAISDGSYGMSEGQSILTHCCEGEAQQAAATGTGATPTRQGILVADATEGITAEQARMLQQQQMKCACGGPHPLKIVGDEVKPIQSYTGELPSPILAIKIYQGERIHMDPTEIAQSKWIRRWAKEAAAYHEVPYEMLAVILQQENAPKAPLWRKIGQAGERVLTSILAIAEEHIVPGIFSKTAEATGLKDIKKGPYGSTGIANITLDALKGTISHTKEKYHRPMLPSDKSDINKGIAGLDVEADMYYLAAHLRQLIDRRVMGNGKSSAKGEITLEQVWEVFADYNGPNRKISGKYGDDSIAKLKGAYNGKPLFFYEE